jgi:hypothetical protein
MNLGLSLLPVHSTTNLPPYQYLRKETKRSKSKSKMKDNISNVPPLATQARATNLICYQCDWVLMSVHLTLLCIPSGLALWLCLSRMRFQRAHVHHTHIVESWPPKSCEAPKVGAWKMLSKLTCKPKMPVVSIQKLNAVYLIQTSLKKHFAHTNPSLLVNIWNCFYNIG